MTDQATPNLPSRDFDSTAAFYERLGFGIVFRDAGWMILQRGDLMLEFFAHPGLDPLASWFSCCLRLDDLAEFYRQCKSVGIQETSSGYPRIHAPELQEWGGTMAALVPGRDAPAPDTERIACRHLMSVSSRFPPEVTAWMERWRLLRDGELLTTHSTGSL